MLRIICIGLLLSLPVEVSANELLQGIGKQVLEQIVEDQLNDSAGTESGQPGSLDVVIDDDGVRLEVVPETEVLSDRPSVVQLDARGRVVVSPWPRIRPWNTSPIFVSPWGVAGQLRDNGIHHAVVAACGSGLVGFSACGTVSRKLASYTFRCAQTVLIDLNAYQEVPLRVLQKTGKRPHGMRFMIFSVNREGQLRERRTPKALSRVEVRQMLRCR